VLLVVDLFNVEHQGLCLLFSIVIGICTPNCVDIFDELHVSIRLGLKLEVLVVCPDGFVVGGKEAVHVQDAVERGGLNSKANDAQTVFVFCQPS